MSNRHYILFFLAGSLLLLPVTSYYAMSWKDLRDKTNKFVNQESTQKLMPLGVVAIGLAAAGLYYYWMGGAKNKSRSDYNLKQFRVYSQFNSDGGGVASCGYQTLLRSMQVVRSKSENEDEKDLEKNLMDATPIEIYFGPDGAWRAKIITWRKEQELRKALHVNFLSALRNNCDDQIKKMYGEQAYEPIIADAASKTIEGDKAKELYASALGLLESIVVQISKNPTTLINQYDFTDQAIQAYLAKSLESLKNDINGALIEILQQPDVINACFNLEEMRKRFLSEDFLLDLPAFMEKIYREPTLQSYFEGDWIDKENIQYLWDNQKNDIVPENVLCDLNVIDDFSLLGNPDVDPTTYFIVEYIKPLLNKHRVFFAIFALGTMENARTGDTISGSQGHWYPLVMHQNKEGKRKYYIMDSASNNRLNDENAWKIIDLIEQQVIEPEAIIEQEEI